MRIKKATILAALIFTLYVLYSMRPVLTDLYKIAWPSQLLFISILLLMLSIFIGYPFCHAGIGPWIMAKRGKRKLWENYVYFGNILQMENDLKELAKQNDQDAIQTLRIINICKWSIIISLISTIVLGIVSSSYAADNPPAFTDFSVKERFQGKPAPIDLNSNPKARRFRSVLRGGAKAGPNFAGHYTVIKWGCGTACAEFAIVDAKNGRVYFPSTIKFNSYALVHDGTEPFQFRKDSALFIIVGEPDETDKLGVYYYKWTGSDLKRILKVERTFEPK